MFPIIQSKLAEGGQSNIFYAVDAKTGEPLVIKECKSNINKKYYLLLQKEYQLMNEKLKGLDCIIKPLAFQNQIYSPYTQEIQAIQDQNFMVLEYAEFGCLQEFFQYTKFFHELTAYSIFQQVLSSVQQIHERGVVHMDIKENNILICRNNNNEFNPLTGFLPIQFKLADFGISVYCDETKNSTISGNCGTAKYMAPEQFSKGKYDPMKSEVYNLGMLFFHFMFKTFPFESNSGSDPQAKSSDFIYNFQSSTRNRFAIKNVSKPFLDMLAMMMRYHPEDRATISQVLECEWIKRCRAQLLSNQQAQSLVRQQLLMKLEVTQNLTVVKIDLQDLPNYKLIQQQMRAQTSNQQQDVIQQESKDILEDIEMN